LQSSQRTNLDKRGGHRQDHAVATDPSYRAIFAGGGLASGLTAYRLAQAMPHARFAVIESADAPGGNHTWSFHETDLPPGAEDWVSPFVAHSWQRQGVRFPARERILDIGYRSITAERFATQLTTLPNLDILTGVPVTHAGIDTVTLADQRTLTARTVFDGRGPQATDALTLGFQKFLGLELRFERPHGQDHALIMDATVPQTDGYRFVYVLPFTDDTALIEDTYYADGHDLPQETLTDEIMAYADRRGWSVAETLREEQGILPITLDGDIDAFWRPLREGPVPIGLRAGLFHPVTGYSVPEAVRLAEKIADLVAHGMAGARLFGEIEAHARRRWEEQTFYRVLNRMLFRAARPEQRYIVFQRFYGLPEALIARFYAGETSWADKARILAGKPPVPVGRALRALPGRGMGQPIEEGLLG